MSKPVPSRFNPDVMARDGTVYAAELPFRQFARLSALLQDSTGAVSMTVRFSRRKDNIVVAGRLSGNFPLECQRCLEPVVMAFDEAYEFVLVESEAEAQRLPEGLDPVILDDAGQIHVTDLFEDELILNLPAVPKHASAQACGPLVRDLQSVDPDAGPVDDDRQARPNPFGVLKDLKLH